MRLALCALVVSATVLLRPTPAVEESIVFAVAKGTSLRKTFDTSSKIDLEHVRMSVGGQELPDSVTKAFEVSSSKVRSFVLVDDYVDVAGGRPVELVRHFEKLERHEVTHRTRPSGKPDDTDETLESGLVGHALRFAWNADSESYDTAWVGDAGDDELLGDLEEDADLRAFLPEGAVSVGDTWDLSGKAVLEAIPPGGRMGFPKKEDDDFDFEQAFDGSAQATYREAREEDGARLAVIAVALAGKADAPPKEGVGGTQTTTFTLDVKYELVWDLAEGHARSIHVEGGIEIALSISGEVDVHGEKRALDVAMDLGGKVEMSASFEKP